MSTDSDNGSDDEKDWLEVESASAWEPTDHERVYARSEADAEFVRASVKEFADAFPEYDIVVTGGPYRSYDVRYEKIEEPKRINLDFYSVRPGHHRLDEVQARLEASMALPDHPDAAGIEPYPVAGYEWVEKRAGDIERGDYIPGDEAGELYYVSGASNADFGEDPRRLLTLVAKKVYTGLFGVVDVFEDEDVSPEFETPSDIADYTAASVYEIGKLYWTLQPIDDEDDE